MLTARSPANSSSTVAGTTVTERPAWTFSSGNLGWGVSSSQVPGWMWAGMSGLSPGSTVIATSVRPLTFLNETVPVTPESFRVSTLIERAGCSVA
jgi:hypothetical protein